MATVKERKIYSVNQFKGIDTENKLLKVEPYRASDGKNFIIDSGTLKTRPALKYSDELPFTLEDNDYVIDFYKFHEITFYMTKLHIYAYDGINLRKDDVFRKGMDVPNPMNFEGYRPLFQEEKNALFIFGVGDIFVFAPIREVSGVVYQYVLYTIQKKLSNPYAIGTDYYNQFDELPTAYEPTIFLGNNPLEDINLLSNVRKYDLFAESASLAVGGKQVYYLPSDYDEEKHGQGYAFSVDFYRNMHTELNDIYPIFMGVEFEDFDVMADYGVILNMSSPENIQDVFFPKKPFEYFGSSEDAMPIPISTIVGLDRDWFLRSKLLSNSTKDVFNFLIDYIIKNKEIIKPAGDTNNKVLAFRVPIEYETIFRDQTTNFIKETIIKRDYVIAYVQLKYIEIDSVIFVDDSNSLKTSNKYITSSVGDTFFPDYPTYLETGETEIDFAQYNPEVTEVDYVKFTLPTIQTPEISLNAFYQQAKDELSQHKEDLNHEQKVVVLGKYFEQQAQVQAANVNVPYDKVSWIFEQTNTFANKTTVANPSIKANGEYDLLDAFPDYPSVVFDRAIDLNGENPIELTNFSDLNFNALANNYLSTTQDNFIDGEVVALRAKYYEVKTREEEATALASKSYTDNWFLYNDYSIASLGADIVGQTDVVPTTPDADVVMLVGGEGGIEIEDFTNGHFTAQFDNHVTTNKHLFANYIGKKVQMKLKLFDNDAVVANAYAASQSTSQFISNITLNSNNVTPYTTSVVKVYEPNYSNPYPAYPYPSGAYSNTFTLTPEIVSAVNINSTTAFVTAVNTFIQNNPDLFSDGHNYKFQQRCYQTGSEYSGVVNGYHQDEWSVSSVYQGSGAPAEYIFPAAPTVLPNDTPNDYYDALSTPLTIVLTGSSFPDLGSPAMVTAMNEALAGSNIVSDAYRYDHRDAGTILVKFKMVTWYTQGSPASYYYKTMIIHALCYTTESEYQLRQSRVATATINKELTEVIGSGFPAMPSFPNGYENLGPVTLNINSGATEPTPQLYDFVSLVEDYVEANLASLVSNYGYIYVAVNGRYTWNSVNNKGISFLAYVYYTKGGVSQFTTQAYGSRLVYVENKNDLIVSDDVIFNNASTFPAFKEFDNSQVLPVLEPFFITFNPTIDGGASKFYYNTTFTEALNTELKTKVALIDGAPQGNAFAKIYVQGTDPSWGPFGTSIVLKFSYTKAGQIEYHVRQSFVMTTTVTSVNVEDTQITKGDINTFMDFPQYSLDLNPESVELPLIIKSGESFVYNTSLVDVDIKPYLLSVVNTLSGGLDEIPTKAYALVRIQTEYVSGQTEVAKGISFVIPFTYTREKTNYNITKQSFSYTALVNKITQVENDDSKLYDFFFDNVEKRFELRLKDYFYDYNNEPSIHVRIEYQFNPDYNLIVKNKFGTTFGSENRLFLAGHPDYPNIDRYNVSNDLLGDNIKNQSYELSYFPSKNYRVMGGKGAINGYVVATDSLLYITKENYPNDDKLFIRQRVLDEKGVVGYQEFKTSVNKTPLNDRCIVRFNNDIVMLTKDGLYAIELSSNVLTDERLLKLRSGFINKDIVESIKNTSHQKIFMCENNLYLYMFFGNKIYVADSRYTSRNENNIMENLSYEIIPWVMPISFRLGKFVDDNFKLLNEHGKFIYELDDEQNFDDNYTRFDNATSAFVMPNGLHTSFPLPLSLQDVIVNPDDYMFEFYNGYKVVGRRNVDYTYDFETNPGDIIITNTTAFRNVTTGKTLYFEENGVFYPFEVLDMDTRNKFSLPFNIQGDTTVIYESIEDVSLYVSLIYTFGGVNYVRLSPYPQSDITKLSRYAGETDNQYYSRIYQYCVDNSDYKFPTSGLQDLLINRPKPIELLWVSNITDFGNRLTEKTAYRLYLYATKKAMENSITFGYQTRRRSNIESESGINVSNPTTFNELNFNIFGMTTFSETGFSLPMKENNFLYIQFFIQGFGQIEVNSFEILYKNNRMLKSVS